MPVEIRPADAADWPSIWPIFEQVVRAGDTYTYDPALTSDEGAALWLEPSPGSTWAAELDGEVLGSYKTGPNRPGPGRHIATASYMVAAAARGQGIGRAMVQHSLALARQAGFRGMQFNAVAASNAGAVKLYSDLGFSVVGRLPGAFAHPQQGYVDLLVMFADLTQPQLAGGVR